MFKIISNIREHINNQITSILIKESNTLHCFILAIFIATSKLIGTKNRENKNPPESEIQRWIIIKLEVNSATALPIIKNGTPAHIKNVNANKNNAIMTNIKFFLSTFE